jgi:multidrug efflux pump subunit AcrA (membrane-fusion protein)
MSKPKFNKNLVRSILLGIGVLLLGVFVSKQLSKKDAKAEPKISFRSKLVAVQPAEPSDIPIYIQVSGRLQSVNRMDLYAEVSGVLKNSNFRSGQSFGAGQPIATIDDSEYRAQLIAARSTFMGLISQSLADLTLDYPEDANEWKLFLQSINPKEKLPELPRVENQQLKQFLSGRNILSNYYTIKSQEVRLRKYQITAPYSGVLNEAVIDPGTLVRSGQKIGTFAQQGSYELEASVTRNDLNFLQKGRTVTLHSDELNQDYTGTISRINSIINPTTQLVNVFMMVRGKELKEGLYLKASINTGRSANAIEIDRNMLIDGKAIFAVNRDSALRLLPVEVISYSEDKAIVEKVPSGTWIPKVQVNGAFEGMKVIPQLSK